VAVFPAKVNKVNFKTYQITSEMQGLEVSVMIVWTIFRDGDGPMRAYRMLGNDLKEAVPRSANDLCASLVSSVVRNQIANDTIDNIIKSREAFREKVMETMKPQMKGWGIWIESVEITDVKIMSGALFKDMQCVFRDDQYQIAQTQMMNVNHEIAQKKLQVKIITDKRNQDKHEKKTLEDSARSIRNKELEFDRVKQDIKISFKNFENSQNEYLAQKKRENAKSIKQMLTSFDKERASNQLTLTEKEKQRELIEQKAKGQIYRLEKNQGLQRDQKQFEIDKKKADWDVQKTKVND